MTDSSATRGDEILLVVHDKDIFPDAPDTASIVWRDRPTVKAVLFNEDDDIALIGNKVNDFFLLPGGGIDDGESATDGLRRECREEVGCEVEVLDELGMTEDFRSRDSKHCISSGYSAKVISHGTPSLTEKEADVGAYVKWIPLSEAKALLTAQEAKVKAGEVKFYNTCFNTIRDLFFIRRAEEIDQK
jgi:ADP-ribose pyrophosphatase YjhB (NUDIX family)